MAIVRRYRGDISDAEMEAFVALAKSRTFTEDEINAMAVEDDSVLPDDFFANATITYPVRDAADVRALRISMGLSQAQFAEKFGLTLDTVQQYEQGRRKPSGPAATLLKVIAAEPEAVMRAVARK